MQSSIHTQGLTRIYTVRKTTGLGTSVTRLTAVDHLDLVVSPGELFGLLGVNGAGKTTTIRMLSTLLEPTSGEASVAGFDVVKSAAKVRQRIGCLLPGERTHYWKLSARENLRFFSAMYGLDPRQEKRRIQEVLDLVGLCERADERVENFSTGMRQRLSLARALLHDPPVLFLDEPTSGLDVHSARALRRTIKGLAQGGKTILLTTHNLQEAQDVCSRIGIIHHGKLVALDTPQGLRDLSGALDIVELAGRMTPTPSTPTGTTTTPATPTASVAERTPDSGILESTVRAVLNAAGVTTPAITLTHPDETAWRIVVKGKKVSNLVPNLLAAVFEDGWEVTGCTIKLPDLEDVFVDMTRDQGAGPEEVNPDA